MYLPVRSMHPHFELGDLQKGERRKETTAPSSAVHLLSSLCTSPFSAARAAAAGLLSPGELARATLDGNVVRSVDIHEAAVDCPELAVR